MKANNHVLDKSFDFSVRIVNLCKYLQNDKKEYILSKELQNNNLNISKATKVISFTKVLFELPAVVLHKTLAKSITLFTFKYSSYYFTVPKQLIRSGTSIGANINEAQAAQSTNDFIAKLSIASKEARETKYWLDLLVGTDYLPKESQNVKSMLDQSNELIKLLTSIIKTTKENNK